MNNLTRKYKPNSVAPIDLSNSGRLDQLIRAGNLYLSLNDAIALSLENNIGIEIQRYQFELTDVAYQGSLAGANGAFDPVFNMNQFTIQHTVQPVTQTITSGNVPTNINDVYNRGFQLQQGFKTGATATLGFTSNKTLTNNSTQTFSPSLSGGLNLNVTQPLLRGGGIGLNTINIKVAKNNQRAADYTFRTQINTQVNQVVQAYWNLVSASLNVGVARQSLELSQRLLDQNKQQIQIGTMAPIDIKQTEAQVATGEQTLITAENAVATQEIAIKNLISRNGLGSASIQSVHIIPTSRVDVPNIEPAIPYQDLVSQALDARPELASARIGLENTNLQMKTTKNALLPQLNLTGLISQPAQSGTLNPLRNGPSPNPDFVGGYGNVLRQLFYVPNINYNFGVTFSINLRNRSQQAAVAAAQLNQRTQELQLQQQVNQIRADVQSAQINITNARARLNAADRGLAAQEAVVDGTQRKYQLGTSTLFETIQQQNSLATARQNVVTAQVAYATAKLAMDVATGGLMERYNIIFDEAKNGTLTRRADPIPDIVNQNAQAAR
ncbi:MAG: TolC family protein [Bryobacteraceae bacterium]